MNRDQCSTASSSSLPTSDKDDVVDTEWKISDFVCLEELYISRARTIFKARENWSNELCVLKRISKSDSLNNNDHVQVERELRIHSHLRHANVIEMKAWFHDPEFIYMVTELADLTVSDLIRTTYSSGIPEAIALPYIRDLIQGLSYLHSHNVVHRDLKPLNLFLKDSVLKIGDFGCSVHTVDMRKSVCGSVPYMSPEMVSLGVYSFPHDIWSLGVTVHEILTGTLPFDGESPIEIYRKICKQSYSPSPLISTCFSDLILSCLDKSPENRKTISLINI